jgi:hypothetical protein
MNQDIAYEILQRLYLFENERDNSAFVAKKLLLSAKSFQEIEKRKIDKPIVLRTNSNLILFNSVLDEESTIYLSNNKYTLTVDKTGKKTTILYPSLSSRIFSFENFKTHAIHPQDNPYIGFELEPRKKDCIEITSGGDDKNIIRIYGHKSNFKIPDGVSRIISIGEIQDLSHLFDSYKNGRLNQNVGYNWDTSNVTNMSYMFRGCRYLTHNIGRRWNTSNVTDMSHMFSGCHVINHPIGKRWDTSKVVNMAGMFSFCYKLRYLGCAKWNISNVKNMEGMFYLSKKVKKYQLKNWDLSSVENTKDMFQFYVH